MTLLIIVIWFQYLISNLYFANQMLIFIMVVPVKLLILGYKILHAFVNFCYGITTYSTTTIWLLKQKNCSFKINQQWITDLEVPWVICGISNPWQLATRCFFDWQFCRSMQQNFPSLIPQFIVGRTTHDEPFILGHLYSDREILLKFLFLRRMYVRVRQIPSPF